MNGTILQVENPPGTPIVPPQVITKGNFMLFLPDVW